MELDEDKKQILNNLTREILIARSEDKSKEKDQNIVSYIQKLTSWKILIALLLSYNLTLRCIS